MSEAKKLNCKEASRIISLGLDRDMAPLARTALHTHLALCSACNVLKAQFTFLRRALSTYTGRAPPKDEPPAS